MSTTKKPNLKDMTKHVVADKVFGKAIEDYGEKSCRNVLVVKEFDKRAEIIVSTNIAKKLEKKPELVKALQELFEVDDDDDDDYSLCSNKKFHLPKLAVPFKDTSRGWNTEVAQDQATLYLNILDYGLGGTKRLVDTKYKTAEKPEWWDDDNNFEKYSHPSKAKVKVNEDVIKSILTHHNYDVNTHCEFPPQKEKKLRGKKKQAEKVLGESLIEDDPAIIDLAVKQKNVEKVHEDMTENNSEEEIPKKRKKKQNDKVVINPEKSWFEINVIDKNIRERKEMEERLGLTKMVQELRAGADNVNHNHNSSEESFSFDLNEN